MYGEHNFVRGKKKNNRKCENVADFAVKICSLLRRAFLKNVFGSYFVVWLEILIIWPFCRRQLFVLSTRPNRESRPRASSGGGKLRSSAEKSSPRNMSDAEKS